MKYARNAWEQVRDIFEDPATGAQRETVDQVIITAKVTGSWNLYLTQRHAHSQFVILSERV